MISVFVSKLILFLTAYAGITDTSMITIHITIAESFFFI